MIVYLHINKSNINYNIIIDNEKSSSGLSESARQSLVNNLTLRRNCSLLYEQLNPPLLMPLLEMNHTFDEEKSMKVRMSSAHRHAQSMAIVEAIMGLRLQTLSIPVISVALNAKEDQRNISQQLIEGEINLDYFNACIE